jgi:hypothetical protein
MPGRDGGSRRSRAQVDTWQRRVTHAVPLVDLRPPHDELGYSPRFRERLEDAAYRLDQALAKARIPYSVSVPEGLNYLHIHVSRSDLPAAKQLIGDLKDKDHRAAT